jgi:hypothetical protein
VPTDKSSIINRRSEQCEPVEKSSILSVVDEAGFWIRLTGVTGNTERAELVVVQIPQTLIGSIKTGFILSLSGLFEREERETLDFRWWSQMWKW